MTHWDDLINAIRASGRFDRTAIMRLALERARRECDAFAAIGLPQAWTVLFAHELRLVWQVAKTAMDGVIAARLAARTAPAERAARALELRAEIALGALPPRESEAADLRAEAAAVRAAAMRAASAAAAGTAIGREPGESSTAHADPAADVALVTPDCAAA
jgi:hypothetical protein